MDVFSKKKRSQVMSLIRSKNTKPELALRKLLSAELYPRGYRYKLHSKKLPGKPDIAFIGRRVAVFMDGAFWHGYKLRNGQSLSATYWLPKIKGNIRRDQEVNNRLKKMDWKVVRIWEHELKRWPEKILDKVARALGLAVKKKAF